MLAVWKGSEYTSVFWNLSTSNFHLKKIDAVNWIQWTMYLWPRHFDGWRANYQNWPFMFIESDNCYCLNCLSTAHIISDENFSFVRNTISEIKKQIFKMRISWNVFYSIDTSIKIKEKKKQINFVKINKSEAYYTNGTL